MAEEFTPAKEEVEQTPVVESAIPKGMQEFIEETKDKPAAEPKVEVKPEEKPPEPPKFEKHEDSGFIQDLKNATPEQYQRRISYLYAKQKDNERQWAEAKDFLKKQSDELEKIRAEQVKERLARVENELDSDQLRVIQLLTPGSENYDAAKGAQLLRELTRKDADLKQAREAEQKRLETKPVEDKRDVAEQAKILDGWAETKDYAKPGHPLYPHVQAWFAKAYATAPPHITMRDIVLKGEEVWDAYVAKTNAPKREDPPGSGVTVSQVLGTGQAKPPANDPVTKLTQQQRYVAEKLFPDMPKEKAYRTYAEGL